MRKMKDLTEMFCVHCGAELLNDFIFSHYNPNNGAKLYKVVSTCPNRKFFISRHTKHTRSYTYDGENHYISFYYEDGTKA